MTLHLTLVTASVIGQNLNVLKAVSRAVLTGLIQSRGRHRVLVEAQEPHSLVQWALVWVLECCGVLLLVAVQKKKLYKEIYLTSKHQMYKSRKGLFNIK